MPTLFLTCSSSGQLYPCDYLQYDTRKWDENLADLRKTYDIGNVLKDEEGCLIRLEKMLKEKIYNFPKRGFIECGACTRFCQINSYLTNLFDLYRQKKLDFKTTPMSLNTAKNELLHL